MSPRVKDKIRNHSFRELIKIFDEKYGIGLLERLIASNWFNPFATLWINFRSFKLSQAIRLPIWCYGRPRFYGLSGSMVVEGRVTTGMIRINRVLTGAPSNMGTQTELLNNGRIVFKGKSHIGTGNKIVVGRNGELHIGANSKIADMCNIGCFKQIVLGEMCRIAHRCQIFDSNYHYMADIKQATVRDIKRPIILGKGCWVCNSSTISCGAILQDYTTVSCHSLVNKDYSQLSEGSIIGGTPAKLITEGVRRIYSDEMNRELDSFYNENPSDIYKITKDIKFE